MSAPPWEAVKTNFVQIFENRHLLTQPPEDHPDPSHPVPWYNSANPSTAASMNTTGPELVLPLLYNQEEEEAEDALMHAS